MTFPLLILPGIFFLLFLLWIALTLGNVYHILRYANWTRMPLILIFIYLFIATCLIAGTGWILRDVDWQDNIELSTPEITIPSAIEDIDSLQDTFTDPL